MIMPKTLIRTVSLKNPSLMVRGIGGPIVESCSGGGIWGLRELYAVIPLFKRDIL